MSKTTIIVLSVIAGIVLIAAVGYGIHHAMYPAMPNSAMPMK